MSSLPYWLDSPYEPRAALEGAVEVEVCVIGAGVGGLSCAQRLAEHGIETLVLERGTVAGGASGRNGGFLLAGVAAFHNDARDLYGRERNRRIYARTVSAQEEVYELAEELGMGDSVRRVGSLRVAVTEEEAERVRGQVQALRDDGFPGELIERDQLPPVLQRRGLCACLVDHDAALHPARWYRALAEAAERAGARICEGTAVQAPVAAPGQGEVQTGGGSVHARHVVVAADGALPVLVPEYEGKVRARRLHMVATEPTERVVEHLVYPRWGYEYFQQRPDGRLLLGGFSDVDGEASYTDREEGSTEVWGRLESYLREELGLDTKVSHRWVGIVGYTEDQLPYVGEVPARPGLHVAGGYSGHGNLPGYVAGQEIADAIAGKASEEPLFGADR
ncbi:MAG TPA: FAD-binding oxidoreductase [Thermoleophilaceae bacterium]|nr:FAD-binding oxidoreductase [Thermoleophilaceae bacterium]